MSFLGLKNVFAEPQVASGGSVPLSCNDVLALIQRLPKPISISTIYHHFLGPPPAEDDLREVIQKYNDNKVGINCYVKNIIMGKIEPFHFHSTMGEDLCIRFSGLDNRTRIREIGSGNNVGFSMVLMKTEKQSRGRMNVMLTEVEGLHTFAFAFERDACKEVMGEDGVLRLIAEISPYDFPHSALWCFFDLAKKATALKKQHPERKIDPKTLPPLRNDRNGSLGFNYSNVNGDDVDSDGKVISGGKRKRN